MPTHIINICGKFYSIFTTKYVDSASREIRVNGQLPHRTAVSPLVQRDTHGTNRLRAAKFFQKIFKVI